MHTFIATQVTNKQLRSEVVDGMCVNNKYGTAVSTAMRTLSGLLSDKLETGGWNILHCILYCLWSSIWFGKVDYECKCRYRPSPCSHRKKPGRLNFGCKSWPWIAAHQHAAICPNHHSSPAQKSCFFRCRSIAVYLPPNRSLLITMVT